MSLNISKSILDIAEDVHVEVNIAKLGPRQQVAFKRMVQTGVSLVHSMPGWLAGVWRQQQGLPTVLFSRHSLQWSGVTQADFFELLTAAAVAARIQNDNYGYTSNQVDKLDTAARLMPADGSVPIWHISKTVQKVFKNFALQSNGRHIEAPQFITIDQKYF